MNYKYEHVMNIFQFESAKSIGLKIIIFSI